MRLNKGDKLVLIPIIILNIIWFGAIIISDIYDYSKYKLININFKDSLYLEINSIYFDGEVKGIIVNDSLTLCAGYDSFNKKNPDDPITFVYDNFKLLIKKPNNDTLITIDKNGQMRYYNVRSGPCYDEDD
jgi:hypothetical protein